MENQAFLRTLGCMDIPGVDGLSTKDGMFLPLDPKNKSAGMVNVSCGTGVYVCDSGPGFSFLNAFFEKGADASAYPYPPQALQNAGSNGANGNAVQMFAAEQLPIKHALAKSFGVFVRTSAALRLPTPALLLLLRPHPLILAPPLRRTRCTRPRRRCPGRTTCSHSPAPAAAAPPPARPVSAAGRPNPRCCAKA